MFCALNSIPIIEEHWKEQKNKKILTLKEENDSPSRRIGEF